MKSRVLVEGPEWMGRWTELAAEGLEELGMKATLLLSNRKPLPYKLLSALGKAGLVDSKRHLSEFYRRRIFALLATGDYDYYISVSGQLDGATLARIRAAGVGTKIVYWIGDRFAGHIEARFRNLHRHVDLIDGLAFAEPGVKQRLVAEGCRKIFYLPFGILHSLHGTLRVTEAQRQRFSSDVSFVSTRTPQREAMVRHLNARLESPVALWGRSWQGSGIPCRGRLSLEETLKVYACSKISLNLHQEGVEGGNMRYFEIPAVGGFQLCDWKPHLPREDFGERVHTFRDNDELVDKINHFLAHDAKRRESASALQRICLERCSYRARFAGLLGFLGDR